MATNGYSSIMPEVGDRLEVLVSAAYCEKEDRVFVVWGQFDFSGVEQIEVAMSGVHESAQRKESPRGQLFPGDYCLAKSIQDNQWYRATIQTATGNDILAFFIDNGNTEFVPRSRIRAIDASLHVDLPAMATRCILMGIQPLFVRSNVKSGTLDYMDRVIVNKTFLCEVMSRNDDYIVVKLFSVNGNRDVCTQIVMDGFAEPAKGGISVPVSPSKEPASVKKLGFTFMGMDVGHRDRVHVSNIISPTHFWVQQEVIAVDLNDLMNDIQAYFENTRIRIPVLTNVSEGMACIAKFSEDGQYYRALVSAIIGTKECDVLFVDYGNTERTNLSSLRQLPPQFAKLPAAAIEACLSHIDPDSCQSEEAIDRFDDLVNERVLCCKVDGKVQQKCSMHMIDPRDENNLSIADILIKENLARPVDPRKLRLAASPTGSSTSSRATPRTSSSISPQSPRFPESKSIKKPMLTVNTKHSVIITAIRGGNDFSIQLLRDSVVFEELTEKIQSNYSSFGPHELSVKDVQLGMTCCAQFSEDDCWYRAEVIFVKGKMAEVVFVDFGNSDMVPFSHIKYLDPKYSSLIAQSVNCRLDGVDDVPSQTTEIKRKFEKLVGDHEHVARICKRDGEVYVVQLLPTEHNVNINDAMRQYCETFKKTSVPEFMSEELNRLKFAKGEKIKMFISNVDSPNNFYCQPVSSADDLQKVMDELNEFIGKTSPRGGMNLQLQAPCVAQFSEDETWYRAVVTGLKRSGEVEVKFVDYGNHDTVNSVSIRPLHPRFYRLPIQAVACSLEGVPVKSWTDDEINKLFELTGEEELDVSFGGKEADNYDVTIITNQGMCINEHFQDGVRPQKNKTRRISPPREGRKFENDKGSQMKETPVMTTFSERELKVGSSLNVYISHVDSLSEFWCQPDFTTADLERLMTDIFEIYGNVSADARLMKNPALGAVCLAQFTQDNNWYRGVIVNKGFNRIKVCFVDYGNTEDISLERLKEVDQKLLKTPIIAVKCCLKGAEAIDRPETVNKLKELVDEVECFKCKVISTGNGVYEVELRSDKGKDIYEILKSVEMEEMKPKEDKLQPRETKEIKDHISAGGDAVLLHAGVIDNQQGAEPQSVLKEQEKRSISSVPFGTSTQKERKSVSLPSAVDFVPGDYFDVVISYITSPAKFWIQLAQSCPEIDTLMENMNDVLLISTLVSLESPKSGQVCVAKSSADGAFYRARILSLKEEGAVIHYIDYGNTETVGGNDLYALPDKFTGLPSQAIECSLSGIKRSLMFTDEIIEAFSAVVMEKQLVCKTVKREAGRLVVSLVDTTGDTDIDINTETCMVISSADLPEFPLPQIPDSGTVFVSQVELDGTLYIHLENTTEVLDQLHTDIQTAYSNPDVCGVTNARVGQQCCAIFSEDGEWYRGVIEVINASQVTVRFVDYGNTSVCSLEELKDLLPQFKSRSALAIWCQLHNVVKTGTEEFANKLQEVTLEKELQGEFVDKEEPCQVVLRENDININELMTNFFRPSQGTDTSHSEVQKNTLPKQWVHHPVEVAKRFEAYVSSITNPNYFFCQPSDVTKRLDSQLNEFNQVYNAPRADLELRVEELGVGSICMAKYSADQSWYRAEVLNLNSNVATVLFPDYGNVDNVPVTDLRRMLPEHAGLEVNALCCSLDGVTHSQGGWSDQTYQKFEDMTFDKPLLIEVITPCIGCETASEAIHSIKLLDMGLNVADKLVESGIAQLTSQATSTLPFPPSNSLVNFFHCYSSQVLSVGSSENIFITAITSLKDFCIQLQRQAEELEAFSTQVDEYYKTNEVSPLQNIQVGAPCAVKFADDQVWYRAVVNELQEDNAEVTFVDYGNGDSVKVADVKQISEEFLQNPAYSCRCSLVGLPEEKVDDEELIKRFEDLLESETLTAEIVSLGSHALNVRIKDGGVSVLETWGLVEEEEPLSAGNKIESCNESTISGMFAGYKHYNIPVGSTEKVFLTHVDSLASFSVQLQKYADDVANHTALVDEYYKTNATESLSDFKVGDKCVAQFSEDEVWYRAEVMTIEGENAEVVFVDYGNSDHVPLSNLKPLQEDFKDAPAYALLCQLSGVKSEDSDIIENFITYQESETLTMKVVRISESGRLQVQLLEEDGTSVTVLMGLEETLEEVVSPSELQMFPGFSIRDLPVDTPQPVFITSATSPSDFYVQLSKDSEEIIAFTTSMHEHYELNSPPILSDATVGSVCAAKYSEDVTWYRANISALRDKEADVIFVDFGNTDTLPVSSVRILSNEFLTEPAFSLRCRLAGVSRTVSDPEEYPGKFLELLDSNELAIKLIRVDGAQLAVQLLENSQSVASKLGLEEDLSLEENQSSDEPIPDLNTTAHDLVEDAVAAALKDLQIGDKDPSPQEDSVPREKATQQEDPNARDVKMEDQEVAERLVDELIIESCAEALQGVDQNATEDGKSDDVDETFMTTTEDLVENDRQDENNQAHQLDPVGDEGLQVSPIPKVEEDVMPLSPVSDVLSVEESFADAVEDAKPCEGGEQTIDESKDFVDAQEFQGEIGDRDESILEQEEQGEYGSTEHEDTAQEEDHLQNESMKGMVNGTEQIKLDDDPESGLNTRDEDSKGKRNEISLAEELHGEEEDGEEEVKGDNVVQVVEKEDADITPTECEEIREQNDTKNEDVIKSRDYKENKDAETVVNIPFKAEGASVIPNEYGATKTIPLDDPQSTNEQNTETSVFLSKVVDEAVSIVEKKLSDSEIVP